jgi:hypothetical protein
VNAPGRVAEMLLEYPYSRQSNNCRKAREGDDQRPDGIKACLLRGFRVSSAC